MTPVSCCLMKRLAKSSDVGRSKMCSLTCQLASSVARWLRNQARQASRTPLSTGMSTPLKRLVARPAIKISMGLMIRPPRNADCASPPQSSTLATLRWRISPERSRYSRHNARLAVSASASQMLSCGGGSVPFSLLERAVYAVRWNAISTGL